MPFKSKAQRRWMYANHPEMAKRWEKDTPKGKKLPEKKKEDGGMFRPDNLQLGGRKITTVDDANIEAKRFAKSRNLAYAEYTHTGGMIPKYLTPDGREVTEMTDNFPAFQLKQAPQNAELLWDDTAQQPYFIDDKTGDLQYMSRRDFYARNPRTALSNTLASRAKFQGGGPFVPDYTYNMGVGDRFMLDVPKGDDRVIPGVTVPMDYNTNFNTPAAQAPARKPWAFANPMFAMRNAQVGLGLIGGAMERGRQNQYMYDQYADMGQMNATPVENFQPNPFSLYAKYGGSIKKYQRGGSIYDYMASRGMDGSYQNRKSLFNDLFNGAYTGSAEQNTELLRMIESGEVALPSARNRRTSARPSVMEELDIEQGTRRRTARPSVLEEIDVLPSIEEVGTRRRTARPSLLEELESVTPRRNYRGARPSSQYQKGGIINQLLYSLLHG